MRVFACAVLLCLLTFSNAHAFGGYSDVFSPQWTNYSADRVDGVYYPLYFPPNPPVYGKPDGSLQYFLGGPGGHNGGRAFQFHVPHQTRVDGLLFDARSFASSDKQDTPDYGTLQFQFNLYSSGKIFQPGAHPETVVPNVPDTDMKAAGASVLLSDEIVTFSFPGGDHYLHNDKDYKDFVVPLQADLGPGDYWLGAETAGGERVTYGNIRLGVNSGELPDRVSAVPEPATLVLLGLGLGGLALRRRYSAR